MVELRYSIENTITASRGGRSKEIIAINWKLEAFDPKHPRVVAAVFGSTRLPPSDGEGFIPFEDLTPEHVAEWIAKFHNADERDELEREVRAALDAMLERASWTQEEFSWSKSEPVPVGDAAAQADLRSDVKAR